MEANERIEKWDCLVLTARNAAQRQIYEQQLAGLDLNGFCAEWIVLADSPMNVRIGSGGATLNAFLHLEQKFGVNFCKNLRVLLLHSGGLSQRIPHVALTGKAFMLMPDAKTLLEHKLRTYRNFLSALASNKNSHGFVFIASADVLEYFPDNFALPAQLKKALLPNEVLLVAHESPLSVAMQHGVFVLHQNENLFCVLQKPNAAQLRQIPGAIIPTSLLNNSMEMALTDSCYLLGHELVGELLRLRKENGPLEYELCCYRDFLCPLGSTPNIQLKKSHFSSTDLALSKWQQMIWDLMHALNGRLLPLGPDSFFHFGTPKELLSHFLNPDSTFRQKFLHSENTTNLVNCRVKRPENISPNAFLEWCRFESAAEIRVESSCILSGLQLDEEDNGNAQEIVLKEGTCSCTIPIDGQNEPLRYVTPIFHVEDDLKSAAGPNGILHWFGHSIPAQNANSTLWDCPLFEAMPTAGKSLKATLQAVNGGLPANCEQLSIAEVFARANVQEMIRQREFLKE